MWIKENIGTLIVAAALLFAVGAIIKSLVMRKKKGKCIGCNYCDGCKRPCQERTKNAEYRS